MDGWRSLRHRVVALVAAHRRRAVLAGTATALVMGLLMAYWELMARYYERHGLGTDD